MLSRLRPTTVLASAARAAPSTGTALSKSVPQGLGHPPRCECGCRETTVINPRVADAFRMPVRHFSSSEDLVLQEIVKEKKIAVLTLNRPKALNALNDALISNLLEKLRGLDQDDNVRVIVLTGSPKAFAAGADIKEMNSLSFAEVSPSYSRFPE